jgi:hypothetical protein
MGIMARFRCRRECSALLHRVRQNLVLPLGLVFPLETPANRSKGDCGMTERTSNEAKIDACCRRERRRPKLQQHRSSYVAPQTLADRQP